MGRYGRSGGVDIFPVIMFTLIGMIAILAFVAISIEGPAPTDPKVGTVYISHTGVSKFCDGTTLVYDGEGTSTIPNSSECS